MVAKSSILLDVYVPDLYEVVSVLIIMSEAIMLEVFLLGYILEFIGFAQLSGFSVLP